MKSICCKAFAVALAAGSIFAAGPASAWVYPEHRDIAVLAVDKLDPERKAQFDRLWGEARVGNEQRLCPQGGDTQQGVAPAHDWAAFTAIAVTTRARAGTCSTPSSRPTGSSASPTSRHN
jgi:hypothetical protein